MASLPATVLATSELDHLPVVEEIVMIETALIDAGPRLRLVDEVWAGALGDLMLREGQRDAIDVCRGDTGRFTLAGAGGHRLRAAQLREIEAVKARIWPNDPVGAELREIADSLHRRDLDPYDRASFVAAAVACVKRRAGIDPSKDGRAASAQARWQKILGEEAKDATGIVTVAYGWAAEVAAELGFSKGSIEKDLLLHRRLPSSHVASLREARHPILANGTQLRALAKLEPAEQARVVDQLLDANADRPVKTVADAQARLNPKTESLTPDKKRFNAVIGALQRMSVTERTGLFQSPQFHDVIPVEARRLLAPMLGGEAEAEDTRATMALVSEPKAAKPAVPVRSSVKPDYIACLHCGERHVHLGIHLREAHQQAPAAYRAFWRLPADYPVVAPYHYEARRSHWKQLLATRKAAAESAKAQSPSSMVNSRAVLAGDDIGAIADLLERWTAEGMEASKILSAAEAAGGSVRFVHGTYEFKLRRVKATCTAGAAGLIRAWIGAARKKIELATALGLNLGLKGASK